MDVNASEFNPMPKNNLMDQIHNTLISIVSDYFSKKDSLENSINKLVVILDAQRKIAQSREEVPNKVNANEPIAKAFVACSVAAANGTLKSIPLLKEVCEKLCNEGYDSLLFCIQNQIYLYTHSDQVKQVLKRMASGEAIETPLEVDLSKVSVDSIDKLPIHIPEMINLMLELIQFMIEKRNANSNERVAPNQICMDLLYLASHVFQLQLDYSKMQAEVAASDSTLVNGDDEKKAALKLALARNKGINEWFEMFCLICESMNKIIPYINMTLMTMNESIINGTGAWTPAGTMNTRSNLLGSRIIDSAFFSASSMTSLFDSTLTRLRELIVQPNLLNKWHARSAALDTLLIAASQPGTTPDPEYFDEASNEEKLNDIDNYHEDYERFLATLTLDK